MLSDQQIDRLSDLFIDLAKASFVGAFAIEILTGAGFIFFIKMAVLATAFAFFSLKVLELKE